MAAALTIGAEIGAARDGPGSRAWPKLRAGAGESCHGLR